MITNAMIGKVYDRINFWDHGEEGIAEGLEQVFRENLGELLAGADDLDRVQDAFVRERVIRDTMAKTGEDRATVTDMLDALGSMGQEAVLDLTEGEPTTMRAAVQRYVDGLDTADHQESDVAGDLAAILAYPFPGPSVELEVERPDDETLIVKVGGELIAGANHDDHGWSGMDLLETTARNVHKAVLERVNKG